MLKEVKMIEYTFLQTNGSLSSSSHLLSSSDLQGHAIIIEWFLRRCRLGQLLQCIQAWRHYFIPKIFKADIFGFFIVRIFNFQNIILECIPTSEYLLNLQNKSLKMIMIIWSKMLSSSLYAMLTLFKTTSP